jgi:hypothetical protein
MMSHMPPIPPCRARLALPLVLFVLVFSGCGRRVPSPQPGEAAPPGIAVVQGFVAAFNRHDPQAMIALAHPEVEWLSVDGASLRVDARGHEALGAAMTAYFADTRDVQSVLEAILASGPYITVQERVFWDTAKGEERSQAALAVYEVRDGLVRRVWYFPPSAPASGT